MRTLKEILIVLFLFASSCSIILKDTRIEFSELFAAKDPFNSFDNISIIGLVVQDTSTLDATYEAPIYDALTQAGMTVTKIDTTTMDQATYNSSNLNWSSLQAVIICAFTDSAAVDTSVSSGIGEVPIVILEPFYWNKFGLPDSAAAIATQDSFRINSADAFIDTTVIWSADDSVAFYSTTSNYYSVRNPTFDTNALLLDLAGTDTIVVFDTLDAQPRIAFGLVQPNNWGENEKQGWTLFNRSLSRLVGTYTDSLFAIGVTCDAKTVPRADQIPLKNHLELNGHNINLVDTDSLGSGSYDGASTDYADFDGFIFWAPNSGTGVEDDSVMTDVNNILTFNRAIADSLGIGTAFAQVSTDTTNVENIWISLVTFGTDYTFNQKIDFSKDSADPVTETITTLDSAIAIVDNGTNQFGVSTHKALRHLFMGIPSVVAPATVVIDSMTSDYWELLNRSFGWIFEGKIMPASAFNLTILNTDSVDADWEDNSSSEGGYSVFTFEPDNAYFSHLAADVVSDSIAPIWPPNSRIRADVAVISGTDSTFSSQGPDTVWTNAAVPPRVNQKSLSDTEMSFDVNGFLFYEHFDDEDFTASPVWTVGASGGIWEVDSVKKILRINTTGAGQVLISTPFSAGGDSINDCNFSTLFRFSDSLAVSSQQIEFRFMNNSAALVDSSGYGVRLLASNRNVVLVRYATNGAGTTLSTATAAIDDQEIFKWHSLRVFRDWAESPADTTVTFTVYLDGDSVTSATDETFLRTDFIGIHSNGGVNFRQEFDEIHIWQKTPSANHDSTQYAVQDSVNGLYVQDAADSLKAGEDWRTFAQLTNGITVLRDSLAQLQPDSLYQLRSKSRNRYPSINN